MSSKIINNCPNADKRKREGMATLKQTNFRNLETLKTLTKTTENFENYVSPLFNTTLSTSEIKITKNETYDLDINAEETHEGEKQLSILAAITSDDKPVPKKIPAISGVDNGDTTTKEVDVKKYKLDWVSQIYIGSISVVGLFVVYRAIKSTI
tara:strand:- start:11145 stop:11603 length:459 start_codon:yes stop_codon:yes gene_type:complete